MPGRCLAEAWPRALRVPKKLLRAPEQGQTRCHTFGIVRKPGRSRREREMRPAVAPHCSILKLELNITYGLTLPSLHGREKYSWSAG